MSKTNNALKNSISRQIEVSTIRDINALRATSRNKEKAIAPRSTSRDMRKRSTSHHEHHVLSLWTLKIEDLFAESKNMGRSPPTMLLE